ncbi:hypothetical protein FB451DRAFT_1292683 [Mycena latifolia]|nr:hypothetical protein FB451DRAFT_1292683 [Mycena latifolia]
MTSPLEKTWGIWLLGLFLQAILYGMALLQVYLYFFWKFKDGWGIRGAVIVITILETFQMGTYFSGTYSYLIDGFGDFHNLTQFNWESYAHLLAIYLSTFVAQVYFANCIYRLHTTDRVTPAIILCLAIGSVGGGIGQIVRDADITTFSQLGRTTVTRTVQASFAFACDLLITVTLCWRLNQSRTGIRSTNNVLNYLIVTAINRGVLTMLTAALNIILFSAEPGTFYFMVGLDLSGKFYMNSMLATLNTRQHAASMLGRTVESVSMQGAAVSTFAVKDPRTLESGTNGGTATAADSVGEAKYVL